MLKADLNDGGKWIAMNYESRLSWIKIGKKAFRTYDGRFRATMDKNMTDYDKPPWILYDVIYGDSGAFVSFKECRKAAQSVYDQDVASGKVREAF